MPNLVSDNLQHYLSTLDQQAEDYVHLARLNAYALGLTRGFVEGFVVALVIGAGVVWGWRWIHH